MMRILVTGTQGQLALSLAETAQKHGVTLIAAGRPDLDLSDATSTADGIARHRPDLIVNAAAYTAVDKAEAEPDLAHAVNALGAEAAAIAAVRVGVPIIHISTDYVFDGAKTAPYTEADAVGPTNVYGRTKLDGERRVARVAEQHVILRTSWVHSPFGANFVKTMLRLAASRPELSVVDDQIGTPTYAPHLAEAILAIAARVRDRSDGSKLWGTFHVTGAGATSWCGFAREIFTVSRRQGGPSAVVHPIPTRDYPTPATRPANSRLDTGKLAAVYGLSLPDWRTGVEACVSRLVAQSANPASSASSKDHVS